MFGIYATSLENESRGAYSSCIKPSTLSDNMLVQKVLSVDSNDSNILYAALRALSDDLSLRLKKRKQIANKVSLEIHYSDGYSTNKIGTLKFNGCFTQMSYVMGDKVMLFDFDPQTGAVTHLETVSTGSK